MKRCARCKQEKPYTEFRRDKSRQDGYGVYCKPCATIKQDEHAIRAKEKAVQAYGGQCANCGEDYLFALVIDHIDGGGCKERKELGSTGSGRFFYAYLKRQGWPKGYQVLCHTCNAVKSQWPQHLEAYRKHNEQRRSYPRDSG